MKNSIITIAAAVFIAGAVLTSCNTPSKKLENAQNNVEDAQENLDKANQEYLMDMEAYRKETNERIAANNQSIAEFNARIANEKMEARADYQRKIAVLDQKNNDLKKRMDDFKGDGKENWEKFKTEFGRDMDELGQAFKNVVVKSNK